MRCQSQDELIPRPDFPKSGWHALVYGWKLRVVSVAIVGGCIMTLEEQQKR